MTWHGYTVNDAELACTLDVSIMLYRTHETKIIIIKFRTKMRSTDGQSREGEGREGEKTTHDVSDALDLARISGPLRASLDDAFEQPDGLVVRRDRGGHFRHGFVRVEGDRVLCAPQRLRQELSR